MKTYTISGFARTVVLLAPNLSSAASRRTRTYFPPSTLLRRSSISHSSQHLSFIRNNPTGTNNPHAASKPYDEPRTGWLHNTQSTPPQVEESDTPARRMFLSAKMKSYRNHRIVHPPAFHPCGENKKMVVTEHKVSVPITYPDMESSNCDDPGSNTRIVTIDNIVNGFDRSEEFERPKLDIYFSIIELISSSTEADFFQSLVTLSPQQRAERYLNRLSKGSSDSKITSFTCVDSARMILYLQGGPGFGCAQPVSGLSLASSKSSWAGQVLLGGLTNTEGKTFQRVVLMDQRGTGRSSPITKQRLQTLFPDLFLLDDTSDSNNSSSDMQITRAKFTKALSEATEYLTKFRADSIVRDAEWIKEALVAASSTYNESDSCDTNFISKSWGAALGQSYGGFCVMTYLSYITNPPTMCLMTGGIAPMGTSVREVYDRLWLRVRERNLRYYQQYPGDVNVVKSIVRKLLSQTIKLPSGGILTARRFLQLGISMGGSPGSSFANLHALINSAFVEDSVDDISHNFLKQIDYQQSFDDAPLYFLLHESIYADGTTCGATNWAAHSSFESLLNTTSQDFDYVQSVTDEKVPTLFFGEMVFPWMAHGDFAGVSGYGIKMLSEALAQKNSWSKLFDKSNMRTALLGGMNMLPKTKAAAAVYYEDMYVDFDCCMKLVQHGEPLEGLKVWVTNEYQHSGLRDDGATIIQKLFSMAKGSIHIPS